MDRAERVFTMERMVFFIDNKAAKDGFSMDRASQSNRLVIQHPVELFLNMGFFEDNLAREPLVYFIKYLMINPHSHKKDNAKSNKMEDPENEFFLFSGSERAKQRFISYCTG